MYSLVDHRSILCTVELLIRRNIGNNTLRRSIRKIDRDFLKNQKINGFSLMCTTRFSPQRVIYTPARERIGKIVNFPLWPKKSDHTFPPPAWKFNPHNNGGHGALNKFAVCGNRVSLIVSHLSYSALGGKKRGILWGKCGVDFPERGGCFYSRADDIFHGERLISETRWAMARWINQNAMVCVV